MLPAQCGYLLRMVHPRAGDLHDPIEILHRGIDKAGVRLDSVIVNQDIEAAHLLQRFGNQPSAVVHLAEVGGDVAGVARAALFETSLRLLVILGPRDR